MPGSMAIKCVQEATDDVTPPSGHVVGWHEPEWQKSQENPTISDQIRHEEKNILAPTLAAFRLHILRLIGRKTRFWIIWLLQENRSAQLMCLEGHAKLQIVTFFCVILWQNYFDVADSLPFWKDFSLRVITSSTWQLVTDRTVHRKVRKTY